MIAHVSGNPVEKFNSSVIIDVNGIGYAVQVANGDYEAITLGSPITLHTYHHIREQSQELFGFTSIAAKKLFELLITVQGVGPKAALAILSIADAETVRNAIANADSVFITKATGVGKRTAERVVVDLSDKVGVATQYAPKSMVHEVQSANDQTDDALEALMALGYSLNDASRALDAVPTDLPTAQRVTQALRG